MNNALILRMVNQLFKDLELIGPESVLMEVMVPYSYRPCSDTDNRFGRSYGRYLITSVTDL
jgi:hypothetical protein